MGIERVRSRWTEGKEREMGARGRGGRGLKEMNKERYRDGERGGGEMQG